MHLWCKIGVHNVVVDGAKLQLFDTSYEVHVQKCEDCGKCWLIGKYDNGSDEPLFGLVTSWEEKKVLTLEEYQKYANDRGLLDLLLANIKAKGRVEGHAFFLDYLKKEASES